MKAIHLPIFIIVTLLTGCLLETKETPHTKVEENLNQKLDYENHNKLKSYNSALDSAIARICIGHDLKINELLDVIPKSFEDYLSMYELTYPEQDSSKQITFDYIDQQMHKLALEGNKEVMIAFLNLSAFVDGEYAEGYYVDVEHIIRLNTKMFCEIYGQLTKEAQSNFINVRLKRCSSNLH